MLLELGIKHRYTRPYRPQTNRKVERFWRTLNDDLIDGTTYVFCTPDGYTDLLHEVGDKAVYERNAVPMDEIVAYLGGLLWGTKFLFDSFILQTLARKSSDLRASPSKTHLLAAYPSLTPSVLRNATERNVSIYDDSTPRYQEILSSFGDCRHLSFQKRRASNPSHRVLVTTVT